ncbi:MAG TPA: hypothetical protein PKC43_04725 [Phycisphaerales bacterium]|nr:hypothetical protein [Phycisphaerales bacterium]
MTYTNLDDWTDATSGVTTINFDELPGFTHVTTQHSHLGVAFIGNSYIFQNSLLFPSDGVGLNGGISVQPITMDFSTPMTAIGVHFPTVFRYELDSNGELIALSFHLASMGPGSFAGIISEIPFDRAIIRSTGGASTVIDTRFSGGAIPGPGGVAVLLGGCGLLGRGRRRGARG